MIEIRIRDTLGVEAETIRLEPGEIAEVSGPNASGKTSVAVCAQAVLANETNPLGLPATQQSHYRHDGSDRSAVDLVVNGVDVLTWRAGAGKMVVNTSAAEMIGMCRPEAVGLTDFTARLGSKQRAAALQAALLPPLDELIAATREKLAEVLAPGDVDAAVGMLAERGWDATRAVFEERARHAKRGWAKAAGRNFGSKVAFDWQPDGWLPDHQQLTVQSAEAAVVDARDALAALHRQVAISQSEHDAAAAAAAAVPAAEEAVTSAQWRVRDKRTEIDAVGLAAVERDAEGVERRLAKVRAAFNAAKARRDDLAGRRGQPCPGCGADLDIDGTRIVPFVAGRLSAEEEREIVRLSDECDATFAELGELNGKRNRLREQERPLRSELTALVVAARDAEIELARLRAGAANVGLPVGELDEAAIRQGEAAVEEAQRVVAMVRAVRDAADHHDAVIRWGETARLLGPDGVRARFLVSSLASLNGGLRVLSEVAEWPAMTVTGDGSITYGGRPVALCSESEQWRAQACIQLTLAAVTDSPVVVLDRGDVLDGANRAGMRAGLGRVAERAKIAVLICATSDGEGLFADHPVRLGARS